ncbi:MAG: hypothetical protein AAF411_24640, partial [Myxococcota bacterium]
MAAVGQNVDAVRLLRTQRGREAARRLALGIVLSLTLHGSAGVFLAAAPAPERAAPAAVPYAELPLLGTGVADLASSPPPLELGGPRSRDNVDAHALGAEGRGGAAFVTLLVSRAHNAQLQDSPLTATTAQQIQRIRTGPNRGSYENRRATPNPADEVYLASG